MTKCKISEWSCVYHACMSDDCQMKQMHANHSFHGPGRCGKKRAASFSLNYAEYSFRCPLCNSKVRKGDIFYLDLETDRNFCLCRLPATPQISCNPKTKATITKYNMQ